MFEDIKHILPLQVEDVRGRLIKSHSSILFENYGINFEPRETLVINSKKNVLRGIHFQRIKEVDKLLMCISGKIYFVAVDLREESDKFGKSCMSILNCGEETYIPKGFGIATLALEDSLLLCQYGEDYYDEYSTGIRWNDTMLGIKWPVEEVIVSDKDKSLLSFREYINNAVMGE